MAIDTKTDKVLRPSFSSAAFLLLYSSQLTYLGVPLKVCYAQIHMPLKLDLQWSKLWEIIDTMGQVYTVLMSFGVPEKGCNFKLKYIIQG